MGWVLAGGYLGIVVLMALESSIVPVPSEIVIPPAAFLAAEGKLSLAGVVLAGTVGSWIGSAVSYWVAQWLGRPLVARYGRFVLLPPEKVARAEVWLRRYQAGGIFFARLLPVIRHLISIPAGIVRMPFGTFSLMTVVGAALWCTVLAYLGKKAYDVQPDLLRDPAALEHFIKHQSLPIVAAAVVLPVLYFLVLRLTGPRPKRGDV